MKLHTPAIHVRINELFDEINRFRTNARFGYLFHCANEVAVSVDLPRRECPVPPRPGSTADISIPEAEKMLADAGIEFDLSWMWDRWTKDGKRYWRIWLFGGLPGKDFSAPTLRACVDQAVAWARAQRASPTPVDEVQQMIEGA